MRPRRIAVVGAGWAGLAAAVEATRRDAAVTVYEMAPHVGGRARSVVAGGSTLDNGQHILIGAYLETLDLLRTLGVASADVFLRMPLRLVDASGAGLRLSPGSAVMSFVRAVLRERRWRRSERLALLLRAAAWAIRGFRCSPKLTVADLTGALPARVRSDLIDPLCVAALNTSSDEASAAVFLRVLRDALFSAPGASDLLLPRVGLSDVVPAPAERWLEQRGVELVRKERVEELAQSGDGWRIGQASFDAVVLATGAAEAARLTTRHAPGWSRTTGALTYEPIVTVYATSGGTRLLEPMLALQSDTEHPAQFVFDRGQLGGAPGLLAFVVSGARRWVERGQPALIEATLRQAQAALGRQLQSPLADVRVIAEKRATFRCTPGLRRPPLAVAENLVAAGDYIDGPYPATLEGAVRAGLAAARAVVPR